MRSEEHTSELQSLRHLVCRLLLEKKKIVIAALKGFFTAHKVAHGPLVIVAQHMVAAGASLRLFRRPGWRAVSSADSLFFLIIGPPPRSPSFPSPGLSG